MKKFRDLVFDLRKDLSLGSFSVYQALEFFDNGYGVSVAYGGPTFSNKTTYEVAVVKGTEEHYVRCYDIPEYQDVMGYLTPSEVTEIMVNVANFKG